MQETGSHRATEIGRPLAATGRRPTAETPDASVSTHKLQRENTDASAGKIDLNSPNFRQQRHHRFHPGYIGSVPRQNSPSAPSGRCAPRKNSPSTPQSGTHRDKIRPANPQSGTHRDKTRPANPQSGTHRDKTRPARQNSAVLAYFRSAGRKISRFLRRHSKQGEFSRADHHPLATLGTLTGTKLSGHTACKAATGTKLSPHTACKATTGTKLSQHSKKHPNQPIRGEQGENYPGRDGNKRRRENFIPQTTTH